MQELIDLAKNFGPYASIAGVLMFYIWKQTNWFKDQYTRLVKRIETLEEDRIKVATDFGTKQTEMTDRVVQVMHEATAVQKELIRAINHNTLAMKARPCLHDANESDVNLKTIEKPSTATLARSEIEKRSDSWRRPA